MNIVSHLSDALNYLHALDTSLSHEQQRALNQARVEIETAIERLKPAQLPVANPRTTLDYARNLLACHVETTAYAAALTAYHAALICGDNPDFCLSDVELRDRAECEIREFEDALRGVELTDTIGHCAYFRVPSDSQPDVKHFVSINATTGRCACSCKGHDFKTRRAAKEGTHANINSVRHSCKHCRRAASVLSVQGVVMPSC